MLYIGITTHGFSMSDDRPTAMVENKEEKVMKVQIQLNASVYLTAVELEPRGSSFKEKNFWSIPEKDLSYFKLKLDDGISSIAGTPINGWIYHLSSNTRLVKSKYNYEGTMTKAQFKVLLR